MLDDCCAVRGILKDDQGEPLHTPSLRMAGTLAEVRGSLRRLLALGRAGAAHGQLLGLAGCIGRGLAAAAGQHGRVKAQVKTIAALAETLGPRTGDLRERYQRLLRQHEGRGGEFHGRVAKVKRSWQAGLFVAAGGKSARGRSRTNLDLERGFR